MVSEIQPRRMRESYEELYDLRDGFTLNYFRRAVDNHLEWLNFDGPIGTPTDKRMFTYLKLERKPGEEAKVTMRRMNLPQNLIAMLDSEVFSLEVQGMIRESELIEERESLYTSCEDQSQDRVKE